MKIYIDSDYHCHTINSDGIFREMEVSFFDDKCDAFIEGYRYIPYGESWIRSDGIVFNGEMISPWKDHNILLIHQQNYERQQLEEYKNENIELKNKENSLNTSYQEGINSI